jgi:hypothetical protein
VAAAARSSEVASILVGDPWVIERAARIVGFHVAGSCRSTNGARRDGSS